MAPKKQSNLIQTEDQINKKITGKYLTLIIFVDAMDKQKLSKMYSGGVESFEPTLIKFSSESISSLVC